MVHYICERFHDNILNSFQLIEPTGVHGGNDYVQSSNGNTVAITFFLSVYAFGVRFKIVA